MKSDNQTFGSTPHLRLKGNAFQGTEFPVGEYRTLRLNCYDMDRNIAWLGIKRPLICVEIPTYGQQVLQHTRRLPPKAVPN